MLKSAILKIYPLLRDAWDVIAFIWLLLSGHWGLALSWIAALLASPYIFRACLLVIMAFLVLMLNRALEKHPDFSINPFLFLGLLYFAWCGAALWGCCILSYAVTARAPIPAALLGMALTTAPAVEMDLSAIGKEAKYCGLLSKFFLRGAFVVAFVWIKFSERFYAPMLWVYLVAGVLYIAGWLALGVALRRREYETERERWEPETAKGELEYFGIKLRRPPEIPRRSS
ncbi:MAG: hypothetical protein LBQ42_00070 [Synergistaceae bacterium]|nr:hypothetical protein [Synergistaceae bacterium]